MIKKYANLFFVNHCALCKKPTQNVLCPDCEKLLKVLNYGCCEICGKPFSLCICKKRKPKFKRCISAFNYHNAPVSSLIYKLKGKGNRLVVDFLTRYMKSRFETEYKNIKFDYITYVPMTKFAKRRKGFDHAGLLSKRLSELLEIEHINPPIKRRTRFSQKYLSFTDRLKNANHVYVLKKGKISGRVLLVDDVLTSGSTLSTCADLLRKAGAKEVYCITAATSAK